MYEFYQKLIETERVQLILEYIYQLNSFEIKLIIFVTVVLIAVMVFKWFGVRILFVLLFVYLFAYVIYSNDLHAKFIKREQDNNEHMKMIESYMPGSEARE